MNDDVLRIPPHAIGPEKSILSTMMQDPQEWIPTALDASLSPDHFYLPSHARIFEQISAMFDERGHCELVELVQRILDRGMLESVGGSAAVTDIYTYAPTGGHFSQHLQIVKDKFVLRSILQAANESIQGVDESPEDVQGLLDATETKISSIRDACEGTKVFSMARVAESAMEAIQLKIETRGAPQGLLTDFRDLDWMTGGLLPGQVFVIAGRPAMGKTSFLMNIIENVSFRRDDPSQVFSLEMSDTELVTRAIYSRAGIALKDENGEFQPPAKGDLIRLKNAYLEIGKSVLRIDDTQGMTIMQIRAKLRRAVRRNGIKLAAIDHLGLIRATGNNRGNREREVAEISAGIKSLAKELGIPVIVLCQLNRESDKRGGARAGEPKLSDLRESGAIEQDADFVGMMYRPSYYGLTSYPESYAEMILTKNRHGDTGVIPLDFSRQFTQFREGKRFVPAAPGTTVDW
jgi:replicative DNA helicase